MKKLHKLLWLIMVPLMLWGCSKMDFSDIGTERNPLVIAFTPSRDGKVVADLAAGMREYLARESGLTVNTITVSSNLPIVEGFAETKVQAALLNTFGYLAVREWGQVEPVYALVHRSGKAQYQGKIIARVDSGISSLSDLQGKKLALKDQYSTSGFVLPLYQLNKAGIKPASISMAESYKAIVKGVYDGLYDAGAIYYDDPVNGKISDARNEILAEHPDAQKKLVIIADTGIIASGPIVVDKRIPEEIRNRLTLGIKSFASTAEGQRLLLAAYDAIDLKPTSDDAYEPTRKMINDLGLDVHTLMPDGYRLEIRRRMQNIGVRLE